MPPTAKNTFLDIHINTNTATPIAQSMTEKLPILAVNLFANGRLQGSVLLFVFDLVLARGSCQFCLQVFLGSQNWVFANFGCRSLSFTGAIPAAAVADVTIA